jgi:glutamate racemase
VMGCTHYPFVIPLIREIVGPQVKVIDPAPAVASQTRRLLKEFGLLKPGVEPGVVDYLTTGDPGQLEALLLKIYGVVGRVRGLSWKAGELCE